MADIIHSKQRLEPVHYQWFMYQLFSGLKYIHSANVSDHVCVCVRVDQCRLTFLLLHKLGTASRFETR